MSNFKHHKVLIVLLVVSSLLVLVQGSVSSEVVVTPVVVDDTINARADIAYDDDTVAVSWAGDPIKGNIGIYVATKALADDQFGAPLTLVSNSNTVYYPPKLDMYNGDPEVVWAEEDTTLGNPSLRNIKESANGTIRMIAQNVCSPYPDPDVVVGATAVHVVYAATDDCNQPTFTDLYYTKRNHASTSWSLPIKIVDRGDANPGIGLSDKIRYPRIAINAPNTTIYVTWEQSINGKPSVWYTSGLGSTWIDATRISPADIVSEQSAVYPAIAVDGANRVHITWTELVPTSTGSISPPAYQNIHHRTFARPTSTQINFQRVYVTDNIPTRAISDVAAFGNYICAAWYGYDATDPNSLEDIKVRCSNDAGQQSWSLTMNMSQSDDWLSPYPSIVIDEYYDMHIVWAELEIVGLDYEPVGLYYNEQSAAYDEPLVVFMPISVREPSQ